MTSMIAYSDFVAAIRNREQAFRFFERQAPIRKAELDEAALKAPLIKTYVIETLPEGCANAPDDLWEDTPLRLRQVDDGVHLVQWKETGDWIGVAEAPDPRYILLHSMEKADTVDRLVRAAVRDSYALDHMWLSGLFLQDAWLRVVETHHDYRFVRVRFEFDNRFEYEVEESQLDREDEAPYFERRSSAIVLTERIRDLKERLASLQEYYAPFHAMSLLRYPSRTGRGGTELHHDGKATNRSDSFSAHRVAVLNVVRRYASSVEALERNAPFTLRSEAQPADGVAFAGLPVVIEFASPLGHDVFKWFVESTFERANAAFRLSGQPIWLSKNKVHIYGLDLHIFQEFSMEVTPEYVELLLHDGACANSVHRLLTNLQRYVSPGLTATIGGEPFQHYLGGDTDEPGTDPD